MTLVNFEVSNENEKTMLWIKGVVPINAEPTAACNKLKAQLELNYPDSRVQVWV